MSDWEFDHFVATRLVDSTGRLNPKGDGNEDALAWLTTNVGKRATYSSKWGWRGGWTLGSRGVWFRDANDAMMFKLTHG